jgi:hypothetical protein
MSGKDLENGAYPPLGRQITPGGHELDDAQPGFPIYHRKFANPAPLGLSAFAATTFLLSLFNVSARGVTAPNLIVGMALAYGGFVQLLAGMWEFAAGNTLGATAFSSYGGFWISFGIILWPSSGILAAYADTPAELDQALGLYLFVWFVFTVMCFITSFRASYGLIVLFGFLAVTFFLLGVGKFNGHVGTTKTGGILGIATAFIAWYNALSGMLHDHWITLPVGNVNKPLNRRR